MNKKQRKILEDRKKELIKNANISKVFQIIMVLLVVFLFMVSWIASIFCFFLAVVAGYEANKYKKELKDVEFRLAGD